MCGFAPGGRTGYFRDAVVQLLLETSGERWFDSRIRRRNMHQIHNGVRKLRIILTRRARASGFLEAPLLAPLRQRHLQSRSMFYRSDNRSPDQLRPVVLTPEFISTAEGSVLIEVGNTRVICTASLEETVPQFMRNSGKGWISSEYSMLPRSTLTRTPREVFQGPAERTHP